MAKKNAPKLRIHLGILSSRSVESKRCDLNRALIVAAQAEAPAIVREFENRRLNAKIELLKALAEELGYKVMPKHAAGEQSAEAALFGVEDSGQLKLLG